MVKSQSSWFLKYSLKWDLDFQPYITTCSCELQLFECFNIYKDVSSIMIPCWKFQRFKSKIQDRFEKIGILTYTFIILHQLLHQKFNKLNRFSPSYWYYQRRFQSGLGLDFVTFYSSQQKQKITISDKPQDKHLC